MSRVAVNKELLLWALERSHRTVDELQNKFPKIEQWITGEVQPTLRQVEILAKKTLTPLGFFFLNEPPEDRLPFPFFRTYSDDLMSTPSPELLQTVQMMQQRQIWMREYLIEEGQDRLPLVNSSRVQEEVTSVAELIRQALRLEEGWAAMQPTWTDALSALREAMEEAGIMVVINGVLGNNTHCKLNPSEFRGFVLVDEYAPLIFVNGSDSKAAQMFTLAHEVAHVFLGSSAGFDLREMQPANDPTEQVCNRIAAELLIPENSLRSLWHTFENDSEPFQKIAREYKVSALVAARRALDIALIDKNRFLEFYRAYLSDERRKAASRAPGGDFYNNQNVRVGQRFASFVLRAAKEGKLLYSEAYKLTGLYGATFDRYTSSIEGGKY
ncbi:MAG: ImmA/IrrE family metallo-endopeptidase [Candidatus Desulfatibia sp.]|uniref:ImmA/IrrE family metallo-endopeptidase n=1 Tax=Candidatus Desulfatibia sp. TaxID=3101189 RepID=UPI002F32AEF0